MNIAAMLLLMAGALLAGLLAAFAFYAPFEEVVEDAQRILGLGIKRGPSCWAGGCLGCGGLPRISQSN